MRQVVDLSQVALRAGGPQGLRGRERVPGPPICCPALGGLVGATVWQQGEWQVSVPPEKDVVFRNQSHLDPLTVETHLWSS